MTGRTAAAAGFLLLLAGWLLTGVGASGISASPDDPRAAFVRPAGVPAGANGQLSQAAVDLGRLLFADTRLSGDGQLACASCHQPQLAFTDGEARHLGRNGKPLPRHTPALWNLAWSETLFWDGRAKTLEAQAAGPIENPQEMAGNLPGAARRLMAEPKMAAMFAKAFPADPAISGPSIVAALAAYERSLVSPLTRFDRFVNGDSKALDEQEKSGFALFTGKAQCAACHSGWRLTDEAFHDIGLPDTGDLGRGAVIELPAANHGFKTPSLRELAWTAPYMHDGSLASLEAVIAHYAGPVAARPTLSTDMPPVLTLTEAERAALIAFLLTASSEDPPRPPDHAPNIEVIAAEVDPAVPTLEVSQKDKQFWPKRVIVKAGESLKIINDDKRTHNVRIDDRRMPFTSNAQEPGDSVVISFQEPGQFRVSCSIHPMMKLDVTVEQK